jgi:hypothetical protein
MPGQKRSDGHAMHTGKSGKPWSVRMRAAPDLTPTRARPLGRKKVILKTESPTEAAQAEGLAALVGKGHFDDRLTNEPCETPEANSEIEIVRSQLVNAVRHWRRVQAEDLRRQAADADAEAGLVSVPFLEKPEAD